MIPPNFFYPSPKNYSPLKKILFTPPQKWFPPKKNCLPLTKKWFPPKKFFFLPLPKKLFPLKNFRGTTIFLGGNNFLGRGEQIFRGGNLLGGVKKIWGAKGGILFRGVKKFVCSLSLSHSLIAIVCLSHYTYSECWSFTPGGALQVKKKI